MRYTTRRDVEEDKRREGGFVHGNTRTRDLHGVTRRTTVTSIAVEVVVEDWLLTHNLRQRCAPRYWPHARDSEWAIVADLLTIFETQVTRRTLRIQEVLRNWGQREDAVGRCVWLSRYVKSRSCHMGGIFIDFANHAIRGDYTASKCDVTEFIGSAW